MNVIFNTVMDYTSYVLIVIYVLALVVNIITEVIKGMIPVPANIVVIVVSVTVTMLAMLAALSIMKIKIVWYYITAAVILGIFVAYAAMFGFDTFRKLWDQIDMYRK